MTGTNNTELSASNYALTRKKLLQLIKQLRAVGAQADLDLPRIAVIGNQSAGKSSVVEAISGINVPRDAGTCTRCPMECRLSSSTGPWSCQVSIRWEFENSGDRKDEISEVLFGSRVTTKADVELRLRQAQTAVLNPHVTAEKFLGLNEDELKRGISNNKGKPLLFSRNVVCVDLEGPELTDLSFIDLPGLIQNAEEEVVRLVEDLVVSHIKGNCLILVTLPMTDDIENQKAMQLARKKDSTGHRTIGVLSKPDMLTAGSTKACDLWLDVIEGRRHALRHGYYCTRQPDDAERAEGISSSQARHREMEFFTATKPWATTTHHERFGTVNLVKTLSELLEKTISNTLPKIQSETASLLSTCTHHLSQIPPVAIGDPSTQMSILLTKFCTTIEAYAQGGPQMGRLIHENRKAWKAFKTAIRGTAPNFKPFVKAIHGSEEFQNWLGDGEDEELVSDGHAFYLRDMRKHLEQSITRELPGNIPFEAKSLLIQSFQQTWHSSTMTCFDQVRDSMLKILNDTISQQFERYGHLQSHLRNFVTELAEKHRASCLALLEAVLEMEVVAFTQNAHYLETCTQKWLAKYRDARAGKSTALIEDQPPAKKQRLQQDSPRAPSAGRPPANRSRKPTGTDDPDCESTDGTEDPESDPADSEDSESDHADSEDSESDPADSEDPEGDPSDPDDPESDPIDTNDPSGYGPPPTSKSPRALTAPSPEKLKATLALLVEMGYTGIKADDLGKLNPVDEYETEIRVMAEVRGYFQVAYKRVIDNVPSLVDLRFVRAVTRELLSSLIGAFELGTSDAAERCAKYLAEDPDVVARRDELVARKKRLESVAVQLYKFGL